MKKMLLLLFVFLGIGLTSCFFPGPCIQGYGPVLSEERDVAEFSTVKNAGSFEVRVTEADSFSVMVEAQENLLALIETYVSGPELVVKTRNGICIENDAQIAVIVTTPRLEGLKLTGSGILSADVADCSEFECKNTGSGFLIIDSVYASSAYIMNSGSGKIVWEASYITEMEISQSGSGSIDAGTLNGNEFTEIAQSSSGRIFLDLPGSQYVDVDLTGSGRIELTGDAHEAVYRLTSSGKIDAMELVAEDVTANISGSGKIFAHATGTLDVTISSSGYLFYIGDPVITTKITGSGGVKPYY